MQSGKSTSARSKLHKDIDGQLSLGRNSELCMEELNTTECLWDELTQTTSHAFPPNINADLTKVLLEELSNMRLNIVNRPPQTSGSRFSSKG